MATEEGKIRILGQLSQRYGTSGAAANAFGRTQVQAAANSNRFGNAVQQAGFQIGDFAVQVASGQSPLRAFIQQGTQLVSMFGPWGAAIGAAGAVVGALVTAFWDTDDAAKGAAKATTPYGESVKETEKLIAEIGGALEDQATRYDRLGDAALAGARKEADAAQARLAAAKTNTVVSLFGLELGTANSSLEARASRSGRDGAGSRRLLKSIQDDATEAAKRLADLQAQLDAVIAASAFDQMKGEVDSLTRALNPLLDAEKTLEERERLLGKAVDAGLISRDLYTASMGRAREQYEEAVDPLSRILDAYARERDLLGLSNEERKIQVELEGRVNEIRKAGIEVTGGVVASLEEQIRATEQVRQANEDGISASDVPEEHADIFNAMIEEAAA